MNWPSIDECKPDEEGGPNARTGFNYQDEIAIGNGDSLTRPNAKSGEDSTESGTSSKKYQDKLESFIAALRTM